jgi:hypothetical protein
VAQPEPKLFPKTKRANAATLKLASVALSVLALGAGAFGYVQYDAARTLRAQLAAATAEANKAGAELSTLRSQLGAAQDRINSQGTKLTAAEQEASTEQHQLDEAQQKAAAEQQQVGREQQELTAAKKRVEDEERKLHDAQAQLVAASRPDLPVRLSFFNAAVAGAKVAVLQNLSNDELDLTLDVLQPGTNSHARKQLVLAARAALRMGQRKAGHSSPARWSHSTTPNSGASCRQ